MNIKLRDALFTEECTVKGKLVFPSNYKLEKLYTFRGVNNNVVYSNIICNCPVYVVINEDNCYKTGAYKWAFKRNDFSHRGLIFDLDGTLLNISRNFSPCYLEGNIFGIFSEEYNRIVFEHLFEKEPISIWVYQDALKIDYGELIAELL